MPVRDARNNVSSGSPGPSAQWPYFNPESDTPQGPPIAILVSGGAMVLLSLIYTVLVAIFTSQKEFSPGFGKAVTITEALYFASFGIFVFFLIRLIVGDEMRTGKGMAAFGTGIFTAVFMIIAGIWRIAYIFSNLTPKVFYRGSEGLALLALGASLFFITILIVRRDTTSRSQALVLTFAFITLALFAFAGLLYMIYAFDSINIWKTIVIFESAGYVAFGALFILLSAYMGKMGISSKYGKPALIASIIGVGFIFNAKALFLIWTFNDYAGGAKVYLLLYGISLIALSVMLALFSMLAVDFVAEAEEVQTIYPSNRRQ